MTRAIDLERAITERSEPPPLQFLAVILLMAIRDGADVVLLGPDPSPGVIGALLQYRIGRTIYDLVPPPIALLPHLVRQIEDRARLAGRMESIRFGSLAVTLQGTEWDILYTCSPSPAGDRLTFHPPVDPELAGRVEWGRDEMVEIEFDWDANDP